MLGTIFSIFGGLLKPLFTWLGMRIFQKKIEQLKEQAEFEKALKEQSAATGYQSQATSKDLRDNSEVSELQKPVNEAKLKELEK